LTRQLPRNVLSMYVVRFAAVGSAIFLFPFIARNVGLTDYGIWLLISSMSLIFMTDFGMGASATRYTTETSTRGDTEGLNRVLSSTLLFSLFAGTLLTVVFVGSIALLWRSLNIPEGDRDLAMTMVVLAASGNFLLGLPASVFRYVLAGVHRYDIANACLLLQIVTRLGLVVAFLVGGLGIIAVAISDVVATLGAGIVTVAACRRVVPGMRISRGFVSLRLLKQMAPYSAQVFVMSIAALVILQADSLIIGVFLPVAMVTLYVGAFRVYQVCRDLTLGVMNALVPEAARSNVLGDEERLRTLFVHGTKYANAVLLLLLVPVLVFAEPTLVAWAGDEFATVADVTQLLGLSLLISNNHLIALGLLTGTGKIGPYTRYHIVWAASNVALSALLVQPLGLIGVALGTAIPVCILEPLYVRTALTEFRTPAREFLARAVLRPLGVAAPSAALLEAAQVVWSPDSFGVVILASAAFVIVFALSFTAVGLDAWERDRLRAALRHARARLRRAHGVTVAAGGQ
jgi:O-antigen/teichoic acid export membrane protein